MNKLVDVSMLQDSALMGLKREFRQWLKTASEQDKQTVGYLGKLKWRYESPTEMTAHPQNGGLDDRVSFSLIDGKWVFQILEPQKPRVNPLLVGLQRYEEDE